MSVEVLGSIQIVSRFIQSSTRDGTQHVFEKNT
jgi:hypothetical protein